jgi:hypothetical protein
MKRQLGKFKKMCFTFLSFTRHTYPEWLTVVSPYFFCIGPPWESNSQPWRWKCHPLPTGSGQGIKLTTLALEVSSSTNWFRPGNQTHNPGVGSVILYQLVQARESNSQPWCWKCHPLPTGPPWESNSQPWCWKCHPLPTGSGQGINIKHITY